MDFLDSKASSTFETVTEGEVLADLALPFKNPLLERKLF